MDLFSWIGAAIRYYGFEATWAYLICVGLVASYVASLALFSLIDFIVTAARGTRRGDA
jgi:hypothetical protein